MNPTRADQIGPLEMFKIGVGPSSSHTVGPMLAALKFRDDIFEILTKANRDQPEKFSLTVELFGSLSATGRGHMTDGAVSAGLMGLHPKEANPDEIWEAMPTLKMEKRIHCKDVDVAFDPDKDLKWSGFTIDDKALPHPNTIRFTLLQNEKPVLSTVMVSIGGGFIEAVDPATGMRRPPDHASVKQLPHPYDSGAEFIEVCEKSNLPPWEVVIENQKARGISEEKLRKGLEEVLKTFDECIDRGLVADGILPGGLKVRRRAKALYERLKEEGKKAAAGDLRPSVYAIAVNEENAAGGRVVTAPTNGSSGLIPAVWRTLKESNKLSKKTLENGLIVASVIGALVKTHASISGAEVGCQGEVGTSCAMAAAGAVAMLGGSVRQMEQAAEIGIEHHLGMTCDPIQGLVQIPCIERNAMGAVKALNALYLSLASDGQHVVSLDRALAVMKQTGLDMNQQYKETATGGLALG